MLLDGVLGQVQRLGDLRVGRARRPSARAPRARARTARARPGDPGARTRSCRGRPAAPRRRSCAPASPCRRTPRRRRRARRCGEISPAPENSSTRVRRLGLAQPLADLGARLLADEQVDERHVRAVARAPARAPRSPVCALTQRSTHGCWVSISRKPQCTTSWSSTTSTRRRSGLRLSSSCARLRHRAGTTSRTCQVPGSRSPNSTTPPLCSASNAASRSPIPALPARAADAVVDDLEHERAVGAADAHRHRGRAGVLAGVAHRLGQHRLGERLERGGTSPSSPGSSVSPGRDARATAARPRREASSAVARGARPSGRWSAARSSVSAAWVSLAHALARLGGQVAVAVERHRDAEQALDHALVDLAREVDPLLELARGLGLGGDDPRHRGQRRRLAERPQQVALGVVERRLGQQPVGEDHADRAPGGAPSARRRAAPARGTAPRTRREPGRATSPTISTTRSSRSACAAIGADSTVTWAPANCSRSSPCAPAARTRRLAAVVAEDDRPAHPRQPADGLAQAVVEARRGAGDPARTATAPRRTARAPRFRRPACRVRRRSAVTTVRRASAACACGHQPEPQRLLGRQVDAPAARRSSGIGIRRTDRSRRGPPATRRRRCAGRRTGERGVHQRVGIVGRKRAVSASAMAQHPARRSGNRAAPTTPRVGGAARSRHDRRRAAERERLDPRDRALAPAAAGGEVEQPLEVVAQRRGADPGGSSRARVAASSNTVADREVREVHAAGLERRASSGAVRQRGELGRRQHLRQRPAEVAAGELRRSRRSCSRFAPAVRW